MGPMDHDHHHRALSAAELMEFSLQWLLRLITVLFGENSVADCLNLFVTQGRLWLLDALPDGQPLNRMWTAAGYSDLSSRRRHPMHRYRQQRGPPPNVRISAYLLPLVPLAMAGPELEAEYHHLLSDPRLVWNFADLSLYADGAVLPHHGTMYHHPGAVYPQEVRVQFGPLVVDPATYWHDVRFLTQTYPLLPEGPPVAVIAPLPMPDEPVVDDDASSSQSSDTGESLNVAFLIICVLIVICFSFLFLRFLFKEKDGSEDDDMESETDLPVAVVAPLPIPDGPVVDDDASSSQSSDTGESLNVTFFLIGVSIFIYFSFCFCGSFLKERAVVRMTTRRVRLIVRPFHIMRPIPSTRLA